MGRHAVMDGDLAAARLIEDSNFHAVAERGGTITQDDIDILDEAVVGDVIVGNVVLNVLDATVIADGDIVERGAEDAGMLVDAARHLEALLEGTDADVAREAGITDILETLLIGDLYAQPVLGSTTLCFETRDFCLCECSHKYK